jgi:hypothetical protein
VVSSHPDSARPSPSASRAAEDQPPSMPPCSVLEAAMHSVRTVAQLATFPLAPPLSFSSLKPGRGLDSDASSNLGRSNIKRANRSESSTHQKLNARRLRAVSILLFCFPPLGPYLGHSTLPGPRFEPIVSLSNCWLLSRLPANDLDRVKGVHPKV